MNPLSHGESIGHYVTSNSLQPHGLWPTRLLCPWDFPGKHTGVGCHFFLQVIFQTQRSNLGLLHSRKILCHLDHQGSHGGIPQRGVYYLNSYSDTICLFFNLSKLTILYNFNLVYLPTNSRNCYYLLNQSLHK